MGISLHIMEFLTFDTYDTPYHVTVFYMSKLLFISWDIYSQITMFRSVIFRELSDQIIVRSDQIKDHYFGDLDLILDQIFRE